MAKIYESIIHERRKELMKEMEEKGDLAGFQFGFKKERSTIDAISRIQDIIKDINKKRYKSRECYLMVALDVKNAFNSARWDGIIEKL